MFLGLELNKVGRDGMAYHVLAGFCHQAQMLWDWLLPRCSVCLLPCPINSATWASRGSMPGTATPQTVGNIIQDAGYWDDAVGVGVTFATIGILCGIILGMVLINYGAKKGYTHVKMTFDEMPESERTGYIRPKERTSVGNGVTNASSPGSAGISAGYRRVVVVVGVMIRACLLKISPVMSGFPLVGAVLVSSMLIGFLSTRQA